MTNQTMNTQGPWDFEPYDDHYSFISNDFADDYFMRIQWHEDMTNEEKQANAQLIAAAPETAAERDKLKAENAELVRLVTIFQGWIEQGQIVYVSPDIIQETSKRNQEAIAKVKGSPYGSSKERQKEELEKIPDDMKCEAFINVYPNCVVLHEFEHNANDNADHDRRECVKVILGYKNGKISLIEGEPV